MSKFEAATTDFLDRKYIPLEQKYKLIIGAVILILTMVIFFFTIFKPNTDELNKLNNQKVTLEKKLEQVKKKARNKERLQKELEETQVVFDEAAKLLPKEQEIPQLLRDISALGRNAGLDFLSFKPGKDTPKDFYAEIPVNINVNGPYHNLGFFLDQVSKLDRIVTVDNIKMGGPKMDAGEMLLASSCTLKTYRFTNKKLPKPKK
jgi:type IV pilus assembly protein PilO